MFWASSAHHQKSLTLHTASNFCVCVCLRHCLVRNYKTVPQTDTNTETGGCMYGEVLLMMSAWRSKHVELYTYRYKIKIYHKLHLLVYLLEYISTLCEHNGEFFNVKAGGTQISHWAQKYQGICSTRPLNSTLILSTLLYNKSNTITGLDRPWGFQEVEAPRFQNNWHMMVVQLSALCTGRFYSPGNIPGTHFC
jgi:hypothetical protein